MLQVDFQSVVHSSLQTMLKQMDADSAGPLSHLAEYEVEGEESQEELFQNLSEFQFAAVSNTALSCAVRCKQKCKNCCAASFVELLIALSIICIAVTLVGYKYACLEAASTHCLCRQVLYNAQLENACSEQGARMSAMDNSSRNASDMLARLTLSYNR